MGPREAIETDHGVDTSYHKIPSFSFTNHRNEEINSDSLEGKILVSNFFFTTCKTICPKMTMQMKRVQTKTFRWSDVTLLSHTVDPEADTLEVLRDYAKANDAIGGKWHFLTGTKEDIYALAQKGYLVSAMEGNGSGEPFIHSELIVLVDKSRRIRGYYDGTDREEISKLIDDIQLLKAQEFVPKKDESKGEET
ncbi:MAG: SCO family protein [Flavobacteriales bacterium]|nr:SCO family protein [Flavobacteriales bacterium]